MLLDRVEHLVLVELNQRPRFLKENQLTKWSQKKRDRVDEILIQVILFGSREKKSIRKRLSVRNSRTDDCRVVQCTLTYRLIGRTPGGDGGIKFRTSCRPAGHLSSASQKPLNYLIT